MSIMKKRIVLVNQSSGFLVVDDLNAYCTKSVSYTHLTLPTIA